MAALKVLLIDDDPRMEALLRGPVGLPSTLLVRDPAGIFEPEADKHGLVLLNAEFQKSFGLCRRFKKKRETASVDVAFFTFSHDREHLRILGEHRALPTHADHYLLPPVTLERTLELLTKTIGAFQRAIVETPPPPEIEAEVEVLEADVLDDDVDVAVDDDVRERTRDDLAVPPDAAEPLETRLDDEFGDAPIETEEPTPAVRPFAELDAVTGDAPISQPEMSMGGFQTDRLSSVESYVSTLHGKFARMEDQIEARAAALEAERTAMQAERDAAVIERDAAVAEARRSAAALADEVRRLTTELEAGQAVPGRAADFDHMSNELATLRTEAEWARAEAERDHTEMTRLRAEADRALGESVRARGEIERLRAEVAALSDRASKAETALAEHKEAARAESMQQDAHLASLEANVSHNAHRLATLGETLRAVRPALATLIELSRDLDLEGVPDADGVPPGFDDR